VYGGIDLLPIHICVNAAISKQGDSLCYYAKLLANIASEHKLLQAGYAQTGFRPHFGEDLSYNASSWENEDISIT